MTEPTGPFYGPKLSRKDYNAKKSQIFQWEPTTKKDRLRKSAMWALLSGGTSTIRDLNRDTVIVRDRATLEYLAEYGELPS